jgi:hypothetical protein
VKTEPFSKRLGRGWADRAWIVAVGIAAVLSLNALTGFIVEPGRWYSDSLALRRQTEAFFRGTTALSESPLYLGYDLVWDHGVQQVWGLGAPAFRFLFEALARAAGFAAFPDRVAFLIGWLLCFIYVADTMLSSRDGASKSWRRRLGIAAVMIVTLGSAPFVTLMSTRFEVYEEVAAYSHLCGIALLAGLLRAAQRPSAATLLGLSVAAGLAGFVRPTLVFYGGVTLAGGLWIAWRAGLGRGALAGMTTLFLAGSALLAASNSARFGAPSEFGHSLNVTDLEENTFALKFGYPFRREPLFSAAKDELGSLFFVRELNGRDWYRPGCVLGQSATYRWHEMYFTGLNAVWLGLFLAGGLVWCGGLRSVWSGWTGGTKNARTFDEAFALVAVPWAFAAFALLFGFYLWSPSISSRYMLDFLPAIAAGISAVVWRLAGLSGSFWPALWPGLAFGGVVVWTAREIKSAEIEPQYQKRVSLNLAATARTPRTPFDWNVDLPEYSMNSPEPAARIPFNGAGWNRETGEAAPAAIFFASNPERVSIELVSPDGRAITREQTGVIRAKIGLEFLERESEQIEGAIARIDFTGPRRERYRRGLQVCFIGMVSAAGLGSKPPSLRISRLSFRANDSLSDTASKKEVGL